MGRVIAIAGLPASGKTTYAKRLRSSLEEAWGRDIKVKLIDDPRKGFDLRWALQCAHMENMTVIITDPHLCLAEARQDATILFRACDFDEIDWIFYENDPKQCLKNAQRRPDKDVELDIHWFSARYSIPWGEYTMPVWKGDDDV